VGLEKIRSKRGVRLIGEKKRADERKKLQQKFGPRPINGVIKMWVSAHWGVKEHMARWGIVGIHKRGACVQVNTGA